MLKPNELYHEFQIFDETQGRHITCLPGEWELTGRWKLTWKDVLDQHPRQMLWIEARNGDQLNWFHEGLITIQRMEFVFPDDYEEESYEASLSKEQRKALAKSLSGRNSGGIPRSYYEGY